VQDAQQTDLGPLDRIGLRDDTVAPAERVLEFGALVERWFQARVGGSSSETP